MPKKVFTINDFSGGMNNSAEYGDQFPNEMAKIVGLSVQYSGKITLGSGFKPINWTSNASTRMTMGYGLITYSAGGQLGYYTTAAAVTATNAIAYGHHNSVGDYVVTVYDQNGQYHQTTDAASYITINDVSVTGDTADNGKIVFYVANGNLRICDSEFDNTSSSNKLFYYADYKRFSSTTGVSYTYSGYYSMSLPLDSPPDSLYTKAAYYPASGGSTTLVTTTLSTVSKGAKYLGSGNYIATGVQGGTAGLQCYITGTSDPSVLETNDISPYGWVTGSVEWKGIYPSAGSGACMVLDTTPMSNAGISTGIYYLYYSYVYVNGQESSVARMHSIESADPFDIVAGYGVKAKIMLAGEYHNNISGIRVYATQDLSLSDGQLYLLLDCDFELGVRQSMSGKFTSLIADRVSLSYGGVPSSMVYYNNDMINIGTFSGETYESINGYSPDELIYPRYKTAVVNSGIAYLGNCMVNGTKYPDTIFKSYPNRLDTFTLDNRLDVVTGDGEDIVKLETFADRILEFKEQTLYIINVASEYEFVESIERGKGIAYPYNSIETDYGIAFINDYGVFLYTGERVINLLLDRDQRRWKYSLEDYQTRFTDFKYATLGYDRRSNKLLIVQDMSPASGEKNGLEFDMVNYAWTSNDELIPDMGNMTNIVTDWDGYPISIISATSVNANLIRYVSTGYMYSSNHTIDIRTPLYTLDGYNSEKTIYKVYITYSGLNTTGMSVKYKSGDDSSYNLFTSTTLTTSAAITTQELIPANSSESSRKKRYSIQMLHSSPSVLSSSFTVHEIKIVYRDKRGRV